MITIKVLEIEKIEGPASILRGEITYNSHSPKEIGVTAWAWIDNKRSTPEIGQEVDIYTSWSENRMDIVDRMPKPLDPKEAEALAWAMAHAKEVQKDTSNHDYYSWKHSRLED